MVTVWRVCDDRWWWVPVVLVELVLLAALLGMAELTGTSLVDLGPAGVVGVVLLVREGRRSLRLTSDALELRSLFTERIPYADIETVVVMEGGSAVSVQVRGARPSQDPDRLEPPRGWLRRRGPGALEELVADIRRRVDAVRPTKAAPEDRA